MSGPLCSDLCQHFNIHVGKCLSTIPEKMVYEGDWKGLQVILKMNMDWFNTWKEMQKLTDGDVLRSYHHEVSYQVETLFGNCQACGNLTSHLMLLSDSNKDKIITATEARTFISLLHQLEPTMLMVLNESKNTVDFYGYCGGLYLLEKVPIIASQVFGEKWAFHDFSPLPDIFEPLEETFRSYLAPKIVNVAFSVPYVGAFLGDALTLTKYILFHSFFQTYAPSENEKFEFIHSLLDAVLNVSSNPYGMLQSCDLHLGNFGVTNDSIVKVLDLDMTYPVNLLTSMFEQKQCSSDDDCWIGTKEDCQSSCLTDVGTCAPVPLKQDLINICETQIPFIFGSSTILKLQKENSFCLSEAIRKLVVFCKELPFIESPEQLRDSTISVKEKLRHIESTSQLEFTL